MTALIATLLGLAGTVLHVGVIVAVLLVERRQPSATLAWIFAIVFLPVVGVVLYLLFGTLRARRIAEDAQRTAGRVREILTHHGVHERLGEAREIDVRTRGFLALARRLSSTGASVGNGVEHLVNAAATYRSIIEAIETAEHHIHVQFYIIQPDAAGVALRDRLARRAGEGIEVRVLCDGLGSGKLPASFWTPLTDAGGEAFAFHPVRRWITALWTVLGRRDRVDFRNHRKIVIVDGRVGFTGGINVGREYLGLDPELGHWRDTHVRIEGPAVLSLQAAFLETWLATPGTAIDDRAYFPDPVSGGHQLVQIVDSGPDRTWSPISHVFMHAYAQAQSRIWITSPYFVPSPEILQTLVSAALRGVDVRVLLPAYADHLLVHLAARSYYRGLLESGARIFHYEAPGWRWRRRSNRRGFVHAKTLVVDSWVGTVGSANMDMRSFNLNFELNAFVIGDGFTNELARQFVADTDDAVEVTLETLDHLSVGARLMYQTARLLSPLL